MKANLMNKMTSPKIEISPDSEEKSCHCCDCSESCDCTCRCDEKSFDIDAHKLDDGLLQGWEKLRTRKNLYNKEDE